MNIIIAGYGFVGKAVFNSIKDNNTVYIVDPKHSSAKISDYLNADGLIICVNTPSTILGDCDTSQIYSVLNETPANVPVLIKSTVLPDKLEKIIADFPQHNICYSPEFLRAATADEDFANQEYMIISGNSSVWKELFQGSLKKLDPFRIISCTHKEAAMVKYTTNCFLSLKVAFFNQIYDMCQSNGANYDVVSNILKNDTRIGTSHMQVPGTDGKRGFGGGCFPKDTAAFIHYCDRTGIINSLVESAIKYNKKVRKTP